ncbi:GIY-YIG nuclease family protein, partial [Acetomicrobium sp. S15 = DSM 107314]|uniref:GIY-YIG nuclease family protein n=1 Tax=Acetomicrobium sp. S15 = DSM 107314 TaxID=2529858 RepID=UPI0018E19764
MYYVHVLYSEVDGKLYVGFTSDLQNRLKLHRAGRRGQTPESGLYFLCFLACPNPCSTFYNHTLACTFFTLHSSLITHHSLLITHHFSRLTAFPLGSAIYHPFRPLPKVSTDSDSIL